MARGDAFFMLFLDAMRRGFQYQRERRVTLWLFYRFKNRFEYVSLEICVDCDGFCYTNLVIR